MHENWGGGGEEGMQSKGYICTCPVVLHRFVDICQQVFRLFFLRMTQHVIYSRVYVIINGSMCGWGGGGGSIAARGVAFHMPWGRGGGGLLAPTPKAMLDDPRLHGIYLDLS